MRKLTVHEKLLWLYARRGGSSPSWLWQLLTGTTPLALLDAVAHPIHSLTQFGLCAQDGTPTPDSPVDIMCNNGALRYGALGRNLLDPSAANVMLGYYINKADGEIKPSPANFIFAKYMPVEPGKTYVAYGRAKSGGDLSDYNRIAWYDSNKTWLMGADYIQNRIAVVTAPANAAYARFSVNPSGISTITVTQEIVDSYNWMFSEGAAEIVPFVPFVGGIYTDGEGEVLTVSGQNLVDLTAVTDGYYYDPNGVYTATENTRLSDFIPVKAGQKYTAYVANRGSVYAFNVRANLFSTDRVWLSQSVTPVTQPSVIVITPTEDGYLRLSANYKGTDPFRSWADWSTLQIVVGEYTLETMPPYESYITPQTVTGIPMLLGVGDYKDAAELVQGIKTGKVGIKVFDGTETFTVSSSGAMITTIPDVAIGAPNVPMNTHFALENSPTSIAAGAQRFGASGTQIYSTNYYMKHPTITTAADFKVWLSALYAAGTPDILVYPRATEQTEQTTPHALHTSAGTNVVDVTAAVEGVELAVEYAMKNAS